MSKSTSEERSIWAIIVETASERQSLTLALVGIVLGVVAHLVAPSAQIPAWILFYSLIALTVVIWILVAALRKALAHQRIDLPKVLTVVADQGNGAHPIILLAPSTLFGTSTLVSVYHRDESSAFEVLVGHGTVRTVQSDMKIQVEIDQWVEGEFRARYRCLQQERGRLAATRCTTIHCAGAALDP